MTGTDIETAESWDAETVAEHAMTQAAEAEMGATELAETEALADELLLPGEVRFDRILDAAALRHAESGAPVFHLADEHEHAAGASTMLGFWVYLMSDCLIFAVLFATYGVLGTHYAGGPSAREVLELPLVAVNTAMLLLSSLTCGYAMLASYDGRLGATQSWLAVTALFGLAFVGLEIHEFAHLVHEGATPERSAFLSAFFTLVGTHGLHVTAGLIWIATLMVQVGRRGLSAANMRRLACFSLFWHFLDVIWIGVFTFVYLMGSLR